MKKYLNIKSIAMSFALLGVVVLQSCNGSEEFDITGDPENKVFINTLYAGTPDIPQNSFIFSLLKTPINISISGATEMKAEFAVQCRLPAEKDIVVKFEIDHSADVSSYMPFPSGVEVALDKNELIIPKGMTKSEEKITATINSAHINLFSTLGAYMLPIKVASVQNASFPAASDLVTVPLIVKTAFSNIQSVSSTASGTNITKSSWTATVNGANAPNLVDNLTSGTYSTISPGGNLEVDMKSVYPVSTIYLRYYTASYRMTSCNVYTKESEADQWELQGNASTTVSNASHYIRFYSAVDARFIRIEFLTGANASYGAVLYEFYAHR
jgi:F5/8 type C domain.